MTTRAFWILTIIYAIMLIAGGGYFLYVMVIEHLSITALASKLMSGVIERPDVLGSLFGGLLGLIGLGQMITRGIRNNKQA